MNVIGFDNEKYMREQSRNIRDRIAKFGGKLYLEFGGKLFDDYHASRVLPGFEPDSKVKPGSAGLGRINAARSRGQLQKHAA